MDVVLQLLAALWAVVLEAAPWLLFGLIIAGLLKGLMPQAWLARWLGGRGVGPVVRAAVIGVPLPLCSCSVVPAAVALRRTGASKGATVSFLVSTPENGADSLALTYALLGPVMTVARPVAAVISAVGAGLATMWWDRDDSEPGSVTPDSGCCGGAAPVASCCDSEPVSVTPDSGCCGGADIPDASPPAADQGRLPGVPGVPGARGLARRSVDGVRYALTTLLDEIGLWLVIGLVLAAGVAVLAPPDVIARWGSGPLAMVLMLVVGVPMYICATASTPVAAALLLAGVSPGTVLVFLLAGPATNLGTVGIVRRELGWRATGSYLGAVAIGSIGAGLLLDWMITAWQLPVMAHVGEHGEMLPAWLAIGSAALLLTLGAWRVAVRLGQRFTRADTDAPQPCCSTDESPAPASA